MEQKSKSPTIFSQGNRNTGINEASFENATGKVKYPLTNDILFHIVLQDDDYALKGLIASLLHSLPTPSLVRFERLCLFIGKKSITCTL